MERLRPLLAETGVQTVGKFLMGTVKGDVHDIGKNLVNIMLEGAGFEVIDLGVQVAPEKFVSAIEEHQPDIVGFSAFLTTTMPMFKANLNALEKAGLRNTVIVMVGGAPVTQEYADAVGADGYAADASACVKRAKALIEAKRTKVPRLMGVAEPAPHLETVLRGTGAQHVISHDRPFTLIGERINPTGRRIFQEQLRAGDLSAIERDVKAQVEGGADVLDVNMGVPLTDEADLLARAITMVQQLTDKPICIDSSVVDALEAGLAAYQGRALVNSIHRRGRADGADPAAGEEVRRGGDRAAERRRRDPDGVREANHADSQDLSRSQPRSTASPAADIVIDPLAMPIGRRLRRWSTPSMETMATHQATSSG